MANQATFNGGRPLVGYQGTYNGPSVTGLSNIALGPSAGLSVNFPEMYRVKQLGLVDMIRILYPITDPNSMFLGVKAHYTRELGYFTCIGESCCTNFGQPRWRIGAVILQLDPPDLWKMKIWVFGESVYRQLREAHQIRPLTNCELEVECINQEYRQIKLKTHPSKIPYTVENREYDKNFTWLKEHLSRNLSNEDIRRYVASGIRPLSSAPTVSTMPPIENTGIVKEAELTNSYEPTVKLMRRLIF
jgi:hypothetical protein